MNSPAFRIRYGNDAPECEPHLESLLAHRSVRRYSDRPVLPALEITLKAAAQSASTSSNLQLWSAIQVEKGEKRDRIADLCGKQRQVQTAPLFFAFLADHYRLASLAPDHAERLEFTEFYTMAVVDAALAAERMVCAAELAGLGICYIGGLRNHPEKVREELNLPRGTFGLFGLCLGYLDPSRPADIKPRLPMTSVFFNEIYDTNRGIGDYDERLSQFYREQNMSDATWTQRIQDRLGGPDLGPRATQLDELRRTGFAKK
jgi:nitroreductase